MRITISTWFDLYRIPACQSYDIGLEVYIRLPGGLNASLSPRCHPKKLVLSISRGDGCVSVRGNLYFRLRKYRRHC